MSDWGLSMKPAARIEYYLLCAEFLERRDGNSIAAWPYFSLALAAEEEWLELETRL